MAQVFISYRCDDSAYVAGMLTDKLRDRFGKDSVFMDIDNIPFGVDFREHISRAVGQCDVLLALIGDAWLESASPDGHQRLNNPSGFVRIEIESALSRNIPVVPVLLDNATMPAEGQLPASLHSLIYRNAAELRSGRDLRHHVEKLIQGIESHISNTRSSTLPPPQPRVGEEFSESAYEPNNQGRNSSVWRWIRCILAFVLFFALGFGGGAIGAEIGGGDAAGFWLAIPIWFMGIALTVYLWRRP